VKRDPKVIGAWNSNSTELEINRQFRSVIRARDLKSQSSRLVVGGQFQRSVRAKLRRQLQTRRIVARNLQRALLRFLHVLRRFHD
jgi:hypothetical protein